MTSHRSGMWGPFEVVHNQWSVKEEEEAELWQFAVLESAVAAGMDTFDHAMDEDQPLDLSLKVRAVDSHPPRPPGQEGKPLGQESPLCLIKDCGCNNHGPRARAVGGSSIYDCGKYGPPHAGASSFSGVESNDCGSERYENTRPCFDQHCVPRQDDVRTNSLGRSWEARPFQGDEERMDTGHINSRFDKVGPVPDRRFKLPYRTCMSADSDKQITCYSTTPAFYDSCDTNPQPYVDLSISNRDFQWRPSINNEERFRHSWRDDPSLMRQMGRLGGWSSSESISHPHWRPFSDTAAGAHPHNHQTLISSGRVSVAPKSLSVPLDKSSSSDIGSKAQTPDSSCMPQSRGVCQSFASTVPLITNSSAKRESSQSSTATKTGQPLMVPRVPYTTIRVTRSPKTFHNQSVRAALDAESRTCPFKRPQDGYNRRGLQGKHGLQEKENIDMTEAKGMPMEGVKMPALDYLISKVLVERIDIPFKPCNTEIKKIYNGESKGRLRLVDLIELQVEESLKA